MALNVSNINAVFVKDTKTLGKQSVYVDFDFGGKVHKTETLKSTGKVAEWSHAVQLTGAGVWMEVTARADKTLGSDKVLGTARINVVETVGQGMQTLDLIDPSTNISGGQIKFIITGGSPAISGLPHHDSGLQAVEHKIPGLSHQTTGTDPTGGASGSPGAAAGAGAAGAAGGAAGATTLGHNQSLRQVGDPAVGAQGQGVPATTQGDQGAQGLNTTQSFGQGTGQPQNLSTTQSFAPGTGQPQTLPATQSFGAGATAPQGGSPTGYGGQQAVQQGGSTGVGPAIGGAAAGAGAGGLTAAALNQNTGETQDNRTETQQFTGSPAGSSQTSSFSQFSPIAGAGAGAGSVSSQGLRGKLESDIGVGQTTAQQAFQGPDKKSMGSGGISGATCDHSPMGQSDTCTRCGGTGNLSQRFENDLNVGGSGASQTPGSTV